MKKSPYILLSLSAILYALPFFFSAYLWWLIFIFPIPLLYSTRMHHFLFRHWYLWGIIVFLLHLHAGILVVTNLASKEWWIGLAMGIAMVMYQALAPAFLFWFTNLIITCFLAPFSITCRMGTPFQDSFSTISSGVASDSRYSIQSYVVRIVLYALALGLFIFWTDHYCMWIFETKEGYPLMHPLILLAHYPALLSALPILGKQILLIFFLAIPASITIALCYKNYWSLLFCTIAIAPWIYWSFDQSVHEMKKCTWHTQLKNLSCMIRAHSSRDALCILARHIKKLITIHPQATIIIMPESALDIIDEKDLCLLSEQYIGKPLHIIFGACHYNDSYYYNALYWICNGELKSRFNKKHAMLITERLSNWMDSDFMRKIYCKNGISITCSDNKRKVLSIEQDCQFIPYICSELFFNEYADNDCSSDVPIIAIINDTLLTGTYLQKLLLLLARFRAIQWQRDIVYVAYGMSVFIDKQAAIQLMTPSL